LREKRTEELWLQKWQFLLGPMRRFGGLGKGGHDTIC
jgi:hypothetical protein